MRPLPTRTANVSQSAAAHRTSERMAQGSYFFHSGLDAWRHRRVARLTDPLLLAYPGSSWLTIGDGKGGNEAAYIEDMGGHTLPSDIETAELA